MEYTRLRGWWVCGHVVGPEVESDRVGCCGYEGLEGALGGCDGSGGGGGGGDGDGDGGGVGPDSDEVEEGADDS